MNYQKKEYTLDDNVRYIVFGLKDICKKLDEIILILQQSNDSEKTDAQNESLF